MKNYGMCKKVWGSVIDWRWVHSEEMKPKTVGFTYRVMLDYHAVEQGANSIETSYVQTCRFGNNCQSKALHTTNHRIENTIRKPVTEVPRWLPLLNDEIQKHEQWKDLVFTCVWWTKSHWFPKHSRPNTRISIKGQQHFTFFSLNINSLTQT